jgi:ATP-dependent DNA helicase RecQ
MSAPTRIESARATLRERWGFDAFRPGQESVVDSILEGRDTVIVMPTGGGKSICYQVPALLLPGVTIVVSPLISLMKDQVDRLRSLGIPAVLANSSQSAAEMSAALTDVEAGRVKLVYVAPERFDSSAFLDRARRWEVSLLAVDEAHCVSQWGHDFRPAYLRIGGVRPLLGDPPVVALTATATPEVRRDIQLQLGLRDPRSFVTGFDRRNLHWSVRRLRNEEEKDRAVLSLLRRVDGSAIVYASTRRSVDALSELLRGSGIPAVGYHAGLGDIERKSLQDAFMLGEARVVVATNAFGMGIDKPDVRVVVHYDMPGSLEAYYQEAGRAGRDGRNADCVLLHAYRDRFTHEFFIRQTHPDRSLVERTFREVRTRAGTSGRVEVPPAEFARTLAGGKGERQVFAALRILEEAGIVAGTRDASGDTIGIMRLVASPERIRGELSGPDAEDALRFLRNLWRLAGGEVIHRGIGLPRSEVFRCAGGSAAARELIARLQAAGFLEWSEPSGEGILLVDPTVTERRLPVDWRALERRRVNDERKLRMMQGYVYTEECRRTYVLRYFGDSSSAGDCQACDVCLGTVPDAPAPARSEKARGKRTQPKAGKAPTATPDAGLLDALRSLRSELARKDAVPAYCIVSNRCLEEIASLRPSTPAQLLEANGMGPAKLEKFGAAILDVVANHSARGR